MKKRKALHFRSLVLLPGTIPNTTKHIQLFVLKLNIFEIRFFLVPAATRTNLILKFESLLEELRRILGLLIEPLMPRERRLYTLMMQLERFYQVIITKFRFVYKGKLSELIKFFFI